MRNIKEMREYQGYALRSLRESRMIDLSEVSEKTGIDRQTLWRWESGKNKMKPSALKILSNFYGTDLIKLFIDQQDSVIETALFNRNMADYEEMASKFGDRAANRHFIAIKGVAYAERMQDAIKAKRERNAKIKTEDFV